MKKVAIFSVPRSGSTWLGSIFDSHPNVAFRFQPLFSYGHKSQLSDQSTNLEIEQFFSDILKTDDPFVLQKVAKKRGLVPSFNKKEISHIVFKEVRYLNIIQNLLEKDREIMIIGIIRNPLAVMNSWFLAPKEFRADDGWHQLKEWRFAPKKNLNKDEEFNGYEKWKEVALMFNDFEEKYPHQFKIIVYSDILKKTEKVIQDIFTFIGLKYDQSTANYLCEEVGKESGDAYSVYKSKNNDESWRSSLNPEIVDSIKDDLKETILEKYLTE